MRERRRVLDSELLKADALRSVEIAFDNVDSGPRLRGRLQRVVGQEADKNTAFGEQAGRFRADRAGGGYRIMKDSLEIRITLGYILILVLTSTIVKPGQSYQRGAQCCRADRHHRSVLHPGPKWRTRRGTGR